MEEIKIVDFEEKYANEIDNIESEEWQADGIMNKFNNGAIIRVAIKDTQVVGTVYGKKMGDLFILDVLIIKNEYRNNGIGTRLMNDLFNILKDKNLNNILVQAVFSNNHMNIEGLMKKFEFSEILRVKGYWANEYPDILCKVCNCMPCECTCVFHIKNIGGEKE